MEIKTSDIPIDNNNELPLNKKPNKRHHLKTVAEIAQLVNKKMRNMHIIEH